ncbi:jg5132 [Pararge aegeria aegeria]|uniref:Jg5132 protein n=1 Tax=Pararge aegeria aegeria TaxID=348720 RepID=A0A8S4QEM5_9NEOP|nr:jg5132 [Pararge aegeria aegeria]
MKSKDDDIDVYFFPKNRNQQIVDNKQQAGSVSEAIEYFDQTATLLGKLRAVQKQLREYIRHLQPFMFQFQLWESNPRPWNQKAGSMRR